MTSVFRYEARGAAKRMQRGRIEAATRTDALARLRARGLTPLALDDVRTAARTPGLNDQTARDLARTLAQLLHSGLPLSQALAFASDEQGGGAGRAAMRIRESVERGERASEGLIDDSGAQARLLRGVLLAGEASGRLAQALDVAAAVFTRAAELRGRIQTALIYPLFVLAATAVTLAVFVLFVTPSLAQAFDGNVSKLPASTQALLALSAWLRANGPLAGLSMAAICFVAFSSSQIRAVTALLLDRLLLSPLGGGVAARLDYSTFARLSGLALSAGVPGAAAFEAASESLRSPTLRSGLQKAVTAIRTGERPSVALADHAEMPASLLKLIEVGEETGNLAQSLSYGADVMSAEAEQRLTRMGAVAGPLVTLGLGGLVASVVLSLFLGLLSLSDMALAP